MDGTVRRSGQLFTLGKLSRVPAELPGKVAVFALTAIRRPRRPEAGQVRDRAAVASFTGAFEPEALRSRPNVFHQFPRVSRVYLGFFCSHPVPDYLWWEKKHNPASVGACRPVTPPSSGKVEWAARVAPSA